MFPTDINIVRLLRKEAASSGGRGKGTTTPLSRPYLSPFHTREAQRPEIKDVNLSAGDSSEARKQRKLAMPRPSTFSHSGLLQTQLGRLKPTKSKYKQRPSLAERDSGFL